LKRIIGIVFAIVVIIVGTQAVDKTEVLADRPTPISFSFTVPDVTNPCTGELMDLTVQREGWIHGHQNNFVAFAQQTGFTSDGYELTHGPATLAFNKNVGKDTAQYQFRHPNGSKFMFHEILIGDPFSGFIVEKVGFTCIGKN
jgi:hypothetical protein